MIVVSLLLGTLIFFLCRWLVAGALGYRGGLLVMRHGPVGRRLLVAFASPLVLVPLSIAGSLVSYGLSGVPEPSGRVMITQVKAGSPAERAGLAVGDRLLTVDGQPVTAHTPVADQVAATGGRPFVITALRGEERLELDLSAEAGRIGIGLAPEIVSNGTTAAIVSSAFKDPLRYYGRALSELAQTLTSRERKVDLGAPIAIVKAAPDRAQAARSLLWGLCLSAMLWGGLLGFVLFGLARPRAPAT